MARPVRVYALGADAIGELPVSALGDAVLTVSTLARSVRWAAALIVTLGVTAIAGWQISDRFGLFRPTNIIVISRAKPLTHESSRRTTTKKWRLHFGML
jgi:hypothetical protein